MQKIQNAKECTIVWTETCIWIKVQKIKSAELKKKKNLKRKEY